jgi:hypothetical protein
MRFTTDRPWRECTYHPACCWLTVRRVVMLGPVDRRLECDVERQIHLNAFAAGLDGRSRSLLDMVATAMFKASHFLYVSGVFEKFNGLTDQHGRVSDGRAGASHRREFAPLGTATPVMDTTGDSNRRLSLQRRLLINCCTEAATSSI